MSATYRHINSIHTHTHTLICTHKNWADYGFLRREEVQNIHINVGISARIHMHIHTYTYIHTGCVPTMGFFVEKKCRTCT